MKVNKTVTICCKRESKTDFETEKVWSIWFRCCFLSISSCYAAFKFGACEKADRLPTTLRITPVWIMNKKLGKRTKMLLRRLAVTQVTLKAVSSIVQKELTVSGLKLED